MAGQSGVGFMPHYYFDIHDGIHVIDDVGQDLPDLEVAKGEAMKIAAGIAGTSKALAENGCALTVVVRTAPDETVITVRLVFNIEAAQDRQLLRA